MKSFISWAFNSSYIGPGIIISSLIVFLIGPIVIGLYYLYNSIPKEVIVWFKENPYLTPLIIMGGIGLLGIIIGLITWLVERRKGNKEVKFEWYGNK